MIISFFTFALALLGLSFLFWRAAKHELIEGKIAFDLLAVAAVGALLFGRVLDFLVISEEFGWSLHRLVFFNKYAGVDFYGALAGAALTGFIFTRLKKLDFWHVGDLAAAPIVFAQGVIALGRYLVGKQSGALLTDLIYASWYFATFLVLKRLARRKRSRGFFVSFYLVSIATIDLMLYNFRVDTSLIFGVLPYQAVMPALFLLAGIISWYFVSRRRVSQDIRSLFAVALLSLFRTRRIVSSIDEAGGLSKSIIFMPYYLGRVLAGILRLMVKEVTATFWEFLHVLGFRKLR